MSAAPAERLQCAAERRGAKIPRLLLCGTVNDLLSARQHLAISLLNPRGPAMKKLRALINI